MIHPSIIKPIITHLGGKSLRKATFSASLVLLFLVLFASPLLCQLRLAEEKIVLTHEAGINSKEWEFSPAFYEDGILFVSTSHEVLQYKIKDKEIDKNVMSIYHAVRDDEGYLKDPEPYASSLMSRMHEGPLTMDRSGTMLYFTRNDVTTKTNKSANKGTRKLVILSATRSGTEWKDLKKLSINTDGFNTCHPSISVNGDTLYFASDRPGGYGGLDLYMSIKKDDEWSDPLNLGPTVNGMFNEGFPFIHADGTLYFASNGWTGKGGLDIFLTQMADGGWTSPLNLGAPFNSPSDDFGLIVDRDNKNGYLSSNRPSGNGGDDIYSFYIIGDGTPLANAGEKAGKTKTTTLQIKGEDGLPLEGATISYLKLDEAILSAGAEGETPFRLEQKDSGDGLYNLRMDMDAYANKGRTSKDGTFDMALKDGTYVATVEYPGMAPQQFIITPDTDVSALDIRMKSASSSCANVDGKVQVAGYQVGLSGVLVKAIDEFSKTFSTYADAQGKFQLCLPCGHIYSISGTKNGVSTEIEVVDATGGNCSTATPLMVQLMIDATSTPLIAGAIIELPNIYFNFNDASIRPDAKKDIDVVQAILTTYYNMEIELGSHTDARGASNFNQQLSQLRSQSVANALIQRGIENKRLITKGYGESKLRNACSDGVTCTEKLHQENRRTEFTILGFRNQDGSLSAVPNKVVNKKPTRNEIESGQAQLIRFAQPLPAQPTFMIIAGAYKESENALRKLSTVQAAGFSEAKIIEIQSIKAENLNAICIGQFSDLESAELLVQQAKALGIEAYVK